MFKNKNRNDLKAFLMLIGFMFACVTLGALFFSQIIYFLTEYKWLRYLFLTSVITGLFILLAFTVIKWLKKVNAILNPLYRHIKHTKVAHTILSRLKPHLTKLSPHYQKLETKITNSFSLLKEKKDDYIHHVQKVGFISNFYFRKNKKAEKVEE